MLLLLANVAVFGWWQGWLPGSSGRGVAVPPEVQADRVRVVPIDRLGGRAQATVPPVARVAERDMPAPATASAPGIVAAPMLCREFVGLDDGRARVLREALSTTGASVELQRAEPATSFMVYLSPAASQADAQRRLADLRRAGVVDVYLIPDGPLRFGISLGVFRQEEGARALAARLAGQGVSDAVVAPRPAGAALSRLIARWADVQAASLGAESAARLGMLSRDCDG